MSTVEFDANRIIDGLRCVEPGCECQRANIGKGKVHCPAHNDEHPSFSVSVSRDGRPLVYCRAGCSQENAVTALRSRSLWPRKQSSPKEITPRERTRTTRYEIRDPDGLLTAIHERQDYSDESKEFLWYGPDGTPSLGEIHVADLPLYGAHLLRDRPGEPVIVVEGEKAADALLAAGQLAVATITGAKGTPSQGVLRCLVGREVVRLWPDNDPSGHDHMARVATGLQALDLTSQWVQWADALSGGDAADFLATHSPEELDQLLAVACLATEAIGKRSVGETLAKDAWPSPLAPEAFHGLAGEFIRVIEPHTEADPAALLFQFLVSVGSAVGRIPYFVAEADRHYLNEFLVLVGETGKGGRKGSSWGHIRQRLASAEPLWAKDNIKSGLATGEGVIWAVRDAIEGYEKVREKGQPTRYERVVIDEGIQDKRLLALETEFARVLRVMARDGNILSTVVRQAWDTGDLHTLTKTTPAKSTGAHISIIGHITQPELRLHLSTTDATNGLANRFLWACSRRSKILPEGGQLGNVDFTELERRLAVAIEFGKGFGEMRRDDDARAIWREVYPALTEGEPGLLGAITSRAEAHVMRLACIYAVLDGSGTIRKEHLLAAVAVWDYSAESCRYIFGHLVGDRIADAILRALRENPDGMNRTQIYNLLGGHVKDENTTRALLLLKEQGLSRMESRVTGGRAAEWWFASSRLSRRGAGE